MPTQKLCNVGDCKEFTFTKLEDFYEIGWSAFQCPNGKGKVVCYCPHHQKEYKEDIPKVLTKKSKQPLNISKQTNNKED